MSTLRDALRGLQTQTAGGGRAGAEQPLLPCVWARLTPATVRPRYLCAVERGTSCLLLPLLKRSPVLLLQVLRIYVS